MTFGAAMRAEWMLDPTVAYLNHGTVGAPPRRVLAAQQAIRDEIERGPSQFLLREVFRFAGAQANKPTRMRRAAADVAALVGARGDDLVFVDNASTGANAVLRSMRFAAGDEILMTDHAYGGVARARGVCRGRARRGYSPRPRTVSRLLTESTDRRRCRRDRARDATRRARVVAILTGGNIDPDRLKTLL